MAYRFQPGEPLDREIARIAGEEIAIAVKSLGERGRARAEGIHEARKSIKKIRALLRLVETHLGEAYSNEQAALRDIGRRLSEVRDRHVVVETLDRLRKKYSRKLRATDVANLRRALVAERISAEKQSGLTRTLPEIRSSLETIAQRIGEWHSRVKGLALIEDGLENTFRRGRKALAKARRHPSDQAYHQLRKRVKDYWYEVRLLEDFWTRSWKQREASLRDLEDSLGNDHNLVVLREAILKSARANRHPSAVRSVLKAMDAYRRKLRKSSLTVARHVYDETPKDVRKRAERLCQRKQRDHRNDRNQA